MNELLIALIEAGEKYEMSWRIRPLRGGDLPFDVAVEVCKEGGHYASIALTKELLADAASGMHRIMVENLVREAGLL